MGGRTLVIAGSLGLSVMAGCASGSGTATGSRATVPASSELRIVPAPPRTDAEQLAVEREDARAVADISRVMPAGSTRLGRSPASGVEYRVPELNKRRFLDIWHRSAALPKVIRLLGIAEYNEPSGPLVVANVETAFGGGHACTVIVELSWRATIPDIIEIGAACHD